MYTSKFTHFEKKTIFDQALQGGLISDEAICWIKDTQQIYVQGQFYNCTGASGLSYIEGTSNSDAVIESVVLPEPGEGMENIVVSAVYLDTNTNMWSHCISAKVVGGSIKLVTGGPAYSVAVVVGGSDIHKCPNAKYRIFYYTQKIQ